MDVQPSVVTEEDSTFLSSVWEDWGDLLDFSVHDGASLSFPLDQPQFDQQQQPPFQPPPPPSSPPQPHTVTVSESDKVRKRDPRLSCSNFLAGIVPCACPELDQIIAEEEKELPEKKRPRNVRVGSGTVRCQVLGCEADISELKGYHKRHRVCLGCATSSSVLIDGEIKRYCQQCGKFHVLLDFDEGKRSCRRKLERHNNRRRRKPLESKGLAEKDPQSSLHSEDPIGNGDDGKDSLCVSSEVAAQEPSQEFDDRHISTSSLVPVSQNIHSDSAVSFEASGEPPHMDGGKDDKSCSLSPSDYENKSAFSSACPTGRISFKLYDWNPAEFPRRLRHQIFQWLACMPVELEGYIRPGCTILTIFIAMPKNIWAKLLEDPVSSLQEFIVKPGNMLYGRGPITVYLNNMIFQSFTGETSVHKVDVKIQTPRLYHVHPNCFEAGKPMEFILCGSNLHQSKFRILVSIAGKYLPCHYSLALASDWKCSSLEHQVYKIYTHCTELNFFGPAFIEVDNESGLSNFIPVLIGDENICSEMKSMQQKFDTTLFSKEQEILPTYSFSSCCHSSESRQRAFSELLLDIAWLLRMPASENIQPTVTTCLIQRFHYLLSFLMKNGSTVILKKVLQNLKVLVDKAGLNSFADSCTDFDMELVRKYMDLGRQDNEKPESSESFVLHSEFTLPGIGPRSDAQLIVQTPNLDTLNRPNCKLESDMRITTCDRSETEPLLNREVVMNVNVIKEWPRNPHSRTFPVTVLRSRPALLLIASVAVCFGLCAAVFHPHKVGEFAVAIRRCLFDKS